MLKENKGLTVAILHFIEYTKSIMFKSVLKKISFFVISVLIIEIILQVTGIIITGGKIMIPPKSNQTSIRILCLGESTTDKRFMNKLNKAWPEYLEEILKEKGLDVKVYNFGRAAITTNSILNDIDDQLKSYKPDFVITMMGINDSDMWALNLNKSLYKEIKIYRLLSWFFWRIHTFFSYKPLALKSFDKLNYNIHDMTNKEMSQYYAYLAHKVVPNVPLPIDTKNKKIKYNKAKKLYEKSIARGYFTQGVLEKYLWILVEEKSFKKCSSLVKKYINLGGILNYLELMSAQSCFLTESSHHKYLKQNSENLSYIFASNAGLYNYQRIHHKIIKSNASHIIMQYPLLSIEEIKSLFKTKPKLYYVENVDNFNKALKKHKVEEIFIDNFAGNFGHTTSLGHKLIAAEAAKKILSILN